MRKRQVKWHLRSIELWWEEGNKLIVKDIFSHRYCLLSLYRLSLTPLRYRLSKSRPYRKYLFTNSNTKCHLSITEFRLFPSILKVSCEWFDWWFLWQTVLSWRPMPRDRVSAVHELLTIPLTLKQAQVYLCWLLIFKYGETLLSCSDISIMNK